MRSLLSIICFLFVFVISLPSCREPAGNEPVIPVDQLSGFNTVEVTNIVVPELGDFSNYTHFVIDSTIYLVSKWINLTSLEMVAIDFDGHLKSRTSFYSSIYDLGVHAEYDPENDLFYIVGEIYDESLFPYSNALFLVVDRSGNLLQEKEYRWEGRYNGISDVVLRQGHMPVLLAWDQNGSMGDMMMTDEILIFLDNNYDSLVGMKMHFENSYYNYMDITPYGILRMVGTQYDSINIHSSYSHKFYAEMNLSGYIFEDNRLDGLNSGHLYLEQAYPMNFYSWTSRNSQGITWKKYAQDGSLTLSTDYNIFQVQYPKYDYALTFSKDPFSDNNILYGYFTTGGGPERPMNHGTYIIKCDDDGLKDYRVAFNTAPDGYVMDFQMSVLAPDQYLFLYKYIYDDGGEQFLLTRVQTKK